MDMAQVNNYVAFIMSFLFVVPDFEITIDGILHLEYDGVTIHCTSTFMDQPSTFYITGIAAFTCFAQLLELLSFISTMNRVTFTLSNINRNAYVYTIRGFRRSVLKHKKQTG